MKRRLAQHWFLVGLGAVLAVGLSFSSSLASLPSVAWLRPALIAGVMFVMALPLQTASFGLALRKPLAPLLGVAVNFALVPLLAWAAVAALPAVIHLGPDTVFGILVAATVPCTLASASVWTRRAGGNDTVSIMVTIATNGLCFLVTPAWLAAMLGQMPNFSPLAMVAKLGLLVVLPITLAQCLRRQRTLGVWATDKKGSLSIAAQCGVLGLVLLGAIGMGNRMSAAGSPPWEENVVAMVFVLVLHAVALAAGIRLSYWLGTDRHDAIAVGIAGSQKTLPVGLEVCAQLHVTILPVFAYHVGQLLLDTIVADRLRKRGHHTAAAPDPRAERKRP